MGSIWRETARLPKFSPLQGDMTTGVLIIGGGDGGVAAVLYELAKGNKNISLDYTAYDMKPMSRSARPSVSGETILPYLKGTTGRCTYLSGNLAEDGAVAVSGSQTVFEGKAIVFNLSLIHI